MNNTGFSAEKFPSTSMTLLTFVSVHPLCFMSHVMGQVSFFRPRPHVGGQA